MDPARQPFDLHYIASPMVSIILVNWETPTHTLACLNSLLSLVGPQPNLIVCDNGSGDGSYSIIREHLLDMLAPRRADWRAYRWRELGSIEAESESLEPGLPEITLVRTPKNLGFAGAVNYCLRWALKNPALEYAWILNNDTEVDARALATLLDAMTTHPDIAVCGSTLLYCNPQHSIQAVGGVYDPWLGRTRHILANQAYSPGLCQAVDSDQFDYVVGGSLFFRRSALEKVGLLAEDYFLYFEELDWACRMRRVAPDYRLGYAPDSLVYHMGGASTGVNNANGNPTYRYASDYFFQTSRLLFARRFYPKRYWLVRASLLGVALNRLRRRQGRSFWMALGLLIGWLPKSMIATGRVE